MESNIGFVLKVAIASGVLSAFIKYVGPYLSIPPTSAIAGICVFVPTLVLLAVFAGRLYFQRHAPNQSR